MLDASLQTNGMQALMAGVQIEITEPRQDFGNKSPGIAWDTVTQAPADIPVACAIQERFFTLQIPQHILAEVGLIAKLERICFAMNPSDSSMMPSFLFFSSCLPFPFAHTDYMRTVAQIAALASTNTPLSNFTAVKCLTVCQASASVERGVI